MRYLIFLLLLSSCAVSSEYSGLVDQLTAYRVMVGQYKYDIYENVRRSADLYGVGGISSIVSDFEVNNKISNTFAGIDGVYVSVRFFDFFGEEWKAILVPIEHYDGRVKWKTITMFKCDYGRCLW